MLRLTSLSLRLALQAARRVAQPRQADMPQPAQFPLGQHAARSYAAKVAVDGVEAFDLGGVAPPNVGQNARRGKRAQRRPKRVRGQEHKPVGDDDVRDVDVLPQVELHDQAEVEHPDRIDDDKVYEAAAKASRKAVDAARADQPSEKTAEAKAEQVAERRLKNIAEPSAQSEDGHADQPQDEIDGDAHRPPLPPEQQHSQIAKRELQRHRHRADRDLDKRPDSRQRRKQRDQCD